tara:strand:+ start:917 stop:1171 length:255 start_codon:yes stop_codon:yes gene_type:complete
MVILDKETKRFENFVLMIEDEIVSEIQTQSNKFKDPSLREELKRPESKALIKVIVIKTMVNLQKKRAFNGKFINSMFGRELVDE